jgi:hypothetical protein
MPERPRRCATCVTGRRRTKHKFLAYSPHRLPEAARVPVHGGPVQDDVSVHLDQPARHYADIQLIDRSQEAIKGSEALLRQIDNLIAKSPLKP